MSQEPKYHKHVDFSVRLSEIHAFHPISTLRNRIVDGLMNMIYDIFNNTGPLYLYEEQTVEEL